jgi:hypothetical protein
MCILHSTQMISAGQLLLQIERNYVSVADGIYLKGDRMKISQIMRSLAVSLGTLSGVGSEFRARLIEDAPDQTLFG